MTKTLWAIAMLAVFTVFSSRNMLQTAQTIVASTAERMDSLVMTTSVSVQRNGTNEQPMHSLILLNNSESSYCRRVMHSRLYSTECNHTMAGSLLSSDSDIAPEELPPRPLLVTGTGRSGTNFLVVLLRWMGLQIAHDSVASTPAGYNATHGAVSWVHAFDQTDQCKLPWWAGFRRHRRYLRMESVAYTDRRNFAHVAHVVRSPLASIRSRWNQGDISALQNSHCYTVQTDFPKSGNKTHDSMRTTLRHWVLWNSFVESIADGVVYKSEDLSINSTVVYSLIRQAGLLSDVNATQEQLQDFLTENAARLRSTNTNHTSKPAFDFSWQLMADVDKEYAIMAQMMNLRYGYSVDVGERNLIAEQEDGTVQTCGFLPNHQQWSCSLATRERDHQSANLKTAN